MNNFSFEYPWVFLLIFLFIGCNKICPLKISTIILPHVHIYSSLINFNSKLLIILKWLFILFAFVSLASPVVKNRYEINNQNGYNLALVLDSSGSMQESGYDLSKRVSKFKVVQELVDSFIQKRVNDNIGIVVFGDIAYTASPLTYDKQMLRDIIKRLNIGIAGQKTALYDGLAMGIKLLKSTNSKNKVLILLTDGVNTAGSIPKNVAIRLANKYKIKVYTIGIGYEGEYDKEALREIALKTNGLFFGARTRAVLKDVYLKIDKLEKSKIRARSIVHITYYYQYPLFLSIIFLFLYVYFRNKRGL